jgi:hypothetical protein
MLSSDFAAGQQRRIMDMGSSPDGRATVFGRPVGLLLLLCFSHAILLDVEA